jgi:solute carrier family 25 aspartate/glutamate transporter 12/13
LLLASDSLHRLAFQLFDRRGQGFITFDDFQYIISATKQFKEFPFNFDSDFVTAHFGAKRQRQITYKEFTQILLGKIKRIKNSSKKILLDFIDEQTIQTFRKFDKSNLGYISLKHFEIILKELRQYQLAEFISAHLNEIVKLSSSTTLPNQISYPYFTAFLQLLSNIESMRKIYLAVLDKKSHAYKSSSITKEDFLTEAQHFPRTTPLQIDILFAITHALHKAHVGHDVDKEYIELNDLDLISANEHLLPYRLRSEIVDEHYKVEHQSVLMKILESGYRFGLGSIAGAVGATAVYPIDLGIKILV